MSNCVKFESSIRPFSEFIHPSPLVVNNIIFNRSGRDVNGILEKRRLDYDCHLGSRIGSLVLLSLLIGCNNQLQGQTNCRLPSASGIRPTASLHRRSTWVFMRG